MRQFAPFARPIPRVVVLSFPHAIERQMGGLIEWDGRRRLGGMALVISV